jgi:uncharacterized Zn-finger protein
MFVFVWLVFNFYWIQEEYTLIFLCFVLFYHHVNYYYYCYYNNTGEKPYKCHVCDKLFYIHHHLKNHMFQHTGELPFQCAKCNKRFKHKFRYERHLRTHEEGGNTDGSVAQTPPSCKYCVNFIFSYPHCLRGVSGGLTVLPLSAKLSIQRLH